jgi:3-hydroxybutyryl-CoA dehydrogenase
MKVSVFGSGTMGAGIAQVAAQAGCEVVVVDTQQHSLDKAKQNLVELTNKRVEKGKLSSADGAALVNRIQWTTDSSAIQHADLVIEAIIENLEIKQELFSSIEKIVSAECILATNTSSLSITSIAAACTIPSRVIGIHFFNPAPVMELVEIIPAIQTHDNITQQAKTIISNWNKTTVLVKDLPGFVVNRIARPFYSESLRIADEGIADYQTIDFALKSFGGFRMGPFELMDMIGHDVNYVVTETVWKSMYYDPRYTPSLTQKRLLEARWLGKKSGKGFYNYADPNPASSPSVPDSMGQYIVNRVLMMLINEAAHARHFNIASEEDIEIAMTKGVNYPKGLLAWAKELGYAYCIQELDKLYAWYGEDRYRCSPWLRSQIP